MLDYRVRSWSLLNLVNDIRERRLVPDAYFQRDLVWREIHKKDFIETILLGLPFPQLFISKGKVDLVEMKTVSCIVDGQQRTNAIIEFIDNKFSVSDKFFRDLDDTERTSFLKYEIAVIELDLENDDPQVQEIFQRINRTANSLRGIEKQASQYATSDFMLTAKLLSDQIDLSAENNEYFKEDPRIPSDYFNWAREQRVSRSQSLFTSNNLFTPLEISRKNHLSYVLNLLASIEGGIFHRNEKTNEYLEVFSENFSNKNSVVDLFEKTSALYLKLKFPKKSYWLNKANFFSLFYALAKNLNEGKQINIELLKANLDNFYDNLPDDYKISATEGVNNLRERRIRDNFLNNIISDSLL
ncbi:DUF262 domain-containing protein [Acinetobacter junii]|uniref:DUF262 domain-containing protein n=1 Tax=Acinetobacter junii TaxID=40215 RepID=UPI003215EF9F